MEFLSSQNSYSQYMNPNFNSVNSGNIVGINNSKIFACGVNTDGSLVASNASPCFANFIVSAVGTYTCTFNVIIPAYFSNAPLVYVQSKQAVPATFATEEIYVVSSTSTTCVVSCYVNNALHASSNGFNVLLIGN